MARGAPIKDEPQPESAGQPKASKRRCVSSACVPCRKRKSKCDGTRPACSACSAVYKTASDCFYDPEGEKRNKTAATATAGGKRDTSVLSTASANDNAEFLLLSIRNLPESEVHELIQQLRKEETRLDIAGLADTWRKAVALPPSTPMEPQSLESDLSMLLGKPAVTRSGESRHFGHTSAMSLVPEDENYTPNRIHPPGVETKPKTWTTVTDDLEFVDRLFELYFRWSHPFYVIFSRECFLKDFRSGRQKYCSSLLVNAILAYACHFTDDPKGRTDPDNFRTAGDHFFEEARRLLYEDDSPSLVTTQALCVLAMREPSAGRDSSGFMYMGRCMRMAIELGLHLNDAAAPALRLTPSEVEVRKVTFWGCFTVDTVWSICVGRISQLPRAAITLDKPMLDEPPADLHPSAYQGGAQLPPGVVTSRMFLQEFSSLSELINDNNYMFFAPKERFTSRRLLDCYNKYQKWYKNLPQTLRLDDVRQPQPHIITLHMLYFTAVVHLFRPMLKVDLVHSDVRPRDICVESSNKVSELLRLYRQHYGMRASQLVLTHILLSVCIVHLLYSRDSQTSYQNLVEGLKALEDLSVCHYFGGRGFKIIHALARKWKFPWPEELNDSKLTSKDDNSGVMSPPADSLFALRPTSSIVSRMGGGVGYSPIPPSTQPTRRESLSMFARPERSSVSAPSHPSSSQGGAIVPSQPLHRVSHPNNVVPSYTPSSSSTPLSLPSTHPTPSSGSAETLFWTPIPGSGVPILARNYQMGAMDLENMLGSADEWDRFQRDGFKMSATWAQEPVNGFDAVPGESYAQGGGEVNTYHANGDTRQYDQMHQQGGQHGGGQGFDPGWWSGENNPSGMG